MDLFKAQFDRISRQLAGLTPSQKMLTGTLLAIMVMTLIWWGRYAGEPETEPLFTQSMPLEQLMTAKQVLDSSGSIHATLSGDRLMVPADQRLQAYSILAYAQALPRGGKDSFDDIVKSLNPLQSQDTTDHMWNHGKELVAAQMIREFPGVLNASVTIDPQHEIRLSAGGNIDPTAAASIQTSKNGGDGAPVKLIEAVADILQSSVAGIKRSNIRVIVDGVTSHIRGDAENSFDANEQESAVQRNERYLEGKVREQLSYIQGVIVNVTVQVNGSTVNEKALKFDPKNAVSKETQTTNSSQESSTPAAAPSEAGVVPNTAFNAGAPSVAPTGATTSREQSETKLENFVGRTETETHTGPGQTHPVTAAVSVPITFFKDWYVSQNPTIKDPSEELMKDFMDKQSAKIRSLVMAATGITQESQVIVGTFHNSTENLVPTPVVSAGMSLRLLSPNRIKEGVLGVMALVSLFMVSSLVKKAAPAPALAMGMASGNSSANSSSPLLSNGEMAVGEASGGDPSLDAVELDEEAIRAQQVVEQVSKLVKENPDSAAALVKRWMNRA